MMSTTSDQSIDKLSVSDESEESLIEMAAPSESEAPPSSAQDHREVFYLNITVVDPSRAVQRKVTSTLETKVPTSVAKVASKVATVVATPERFASVMSQEMGPRLAEKLEDKGFPTDVKVVYQEGSYLVVEMRVKAVNLSRMIDQASRSHVDDDGDVDQAKLSISFAKILLFILRFFFSLIGQSNQRALQETVIPDVFQNDMGRIIGEVMAEKMEKKGFEADSLVVPEAKQARFFFDKLQELRTAKEQNGPLTRLKGKLASYRRPVKDAQKIQ